MASVLESLVARGRRVRNYRDQREVCFGLADLSTDQSVHERLVRKGGIGTLSNLLATAQDAEAQQFAALGIANTSSSRALCEEIVQLDGLVEGLIEFVANEKVGVLCPEEFFPAAGVMSDVQSGVLPGRFDRSSIQCNGIGEFISGA